MPYAHPSGFSPRLLDYADDGEGQGGCLANRSAGACPPRLLDDANDGKGQGAVFFTVARGPVPRERWSARTMARDRVPFFSP